MGREAKEGREMTPTHTVTIAGDVFAFNQVDQDVYSWLDANKVPDCGACHEPLTNEGSTRWPLRLATERDPWALRVACVHCGWTSENAEEA